MIEEIGKNLVKLKQEFMQIYDGTSHIQEVIPTTKSSLFPVDENHLESLHLFAKKNPIYYDWHEKKISGVSCVVYEGDINKYWLSSISHGSSHAPFSPTWIFSAYICSLLTKNIGYKEIIDIGSGDGRIAYCAKILGLNSYSIEIDEMLVDLQNIISQSTNIDFNPNCDDAIFFDYSSLNLTHPAFFIGGLAQMGGVLLANGIIKNICSNHLEEKAGIVFAGTFSKKYPEDPMSEAGWGTTIYQNNLKIITTIILPTVWTFKESDDTPYIFTNFVKK